MTATTLSPKPTTTIALDDAGNMDALIGLCGRILLDRGALTHDVIRLLHRARQAAAVDQALALSLLTEQGFRFVHQGRALESLTDLRRH